MRHSNGTFPYIQISTIPELSAGVGGVLVGVRHITFHISTQVSTHLQVIIPLVELREGEIVVEKQAEGECFHSFVE